MGVDGVNGGKGVVVGGLGGAVDGVVDGGTGVGVVTTVVAWLGKIVVVNGVE